MHSSLASQTYTNNIGADSDLINETIMIKQVILLSIFFLGLNGCDGFWENIYVGDKVYKNDVRENNIVEEILVLRNTVDTPSFISSYLFERVSYAEEHEPYKKKDSANRIL
ncbi:MAG: hypothetical protein J0L94_16245 [Rhodothermia bacterium]|nr:hypothetical protein [Rhodothermia bacterium]